MDVAKSDVSPTRLKNQEGHNQRAIVGLCMTIANSRTAATKHHNCHQLLRGPVTSLFGGKMMHGVCVTCTPSNIKAYKFINI